MCDELVKKLRDNGSLFVKYIPNAEGEVLLQAADAIEELSVQAENGEAAYDIMVRQTAYIEELQKQLPRWISVEERLPEEGKLVLIWRDNGVPYVSRLSDVTYWHGLGRSAGVTHWMQLLEPPKEET